jgi:hypothetical protein
LRTRPNNTQYIHAADVHRDEPSEIQVVPQPTPKQSSNHIPISCSIIFCYSFKCISNFIF